MSKTQTKGELKLFRRKEDGNYYIRGTYYKHEVYESTGCKVRKDANDKLRDKRREIEDLVLNKLGPKIQPTFAELAVKYEKEAVKKSIVTDKRHIDALIPYIGDLPMNRVFRGFDGQSNPTPLEKFLLDRARKGKGKPGKVFQPYGVRTLNGAIETINMIGNAASRRWRDDRGEPVIPFFTPVYKMKIQDVRSLGLKPKTTPPVLSWPNQIIFFSKMDNRVKDLCEFLLNTGIRAGELTKLLWEYLHTNDESGIRYFIIPDIEHKNGENRIIVLNSVAEKIIDRQIGKHPEFVFTYRGEPFKKVNSTSFRKARAKAAMINSEIGGVTVHSLKHTFSTRLRAALVPLEDRNELCGHKAGSMTTHYSLGDLIKLTEYTERVAKKPKSMIVPLQRRGNAK